MQRAGNYPGMLVVRPIRRALGYRPKYNRIGLQRSLDLGIHGRAVRHAVVRFSIRILQWRVSNSAFSKSPKVLIAKALDSFSAMWPRYIQAIIRTSIESSLR